MLVGLCASCATLDQFGALVQPPRVPLDLTMNFSSVPDLARLVRDAARSEPIPYRFEGTIGVDAGRLGQPVFGPMTLFSGELRTR